MSRLDSLEPIQWVEDEVRAILELRNSPDQKTYTRQELYGLQSQLLDAAAMGEMENVREILAFGFRALTCEGLRVALKSLEIGKDRVSFEERYIREEQGL